MKVTYTVEGGELSIIWEAETPEEEAELKEQALRIARGDVPDEVLDEIDLCPMGCGRTTKDPYGGPCRACWDAAPMLP